MEFKIPEPLTLEHQELHQELLKIIDSGGDVGKAAREVAQVLHPHFMAEEEYAMPPLGLLSKMQSGEVTPEMADVIALTDRLKASLPKMLQEHKEITKAARHLEEVARNQGHPGGIRFAEKLVLHARTEEEVLYPASLLVGELVKIKLGK